MNRDRFFGIAKQAVGVLEEQWGELIHDQLTIAAGTRDRIAGRIRERLGNSNQEAAWQFEEFMNRNRNWWNVSKR